MVSLLLSSLFTLVQLNCENLFDCQHDSLKNDYEWLPDGNRRWTPYRYWRKVEKIAKEVVACGNGSLPDLVALCEVESDSVMNRLVRRTALGRLGYDYVVTESPDLRGIDVALVYNKFSFLPLCHYSLRVPTVAGMKPTRDILYVKGRVGKTDTLHVFVVHAPSRYGGERKTCPYRMAVMRRLTTFTDSILAIDPKAKIVVAGDFNAYGKAASLEYLQEKGLDDISKDAWGEHGAKATYCYKGRWNSLDHVFVSASLRPQWVSTVVFDAPYLLEEDAAFGTVKPRRTFNGFRYQDDGFSDHLPLVVKFLFE